MVTTTSYKKYKGSGYKRRDAEAIEAWRKVARQRKMTLLRRLRPLIKIAIVLLIVIATSTSTYLLIAFVNSTVEKRDVANGAFVEWLDFNEDDTAVVTSSETCDELGRTIVMDGTLLAELPLVLAVCLNLVEPHRAGVFGMGHLVAVNRSKPMDVISQEYQYNWTEPFAENHFSFLTKGPYSVMLTEERQTLLERLVVRIDSEAMDPQKKEYYKMTTLWRLLAEVFKSHSYLKNPVSPSLATALQDNDEFVTNSVAFNEECCSKLFTKNSRVLQLGEVFDVEVVLKQKASEMNYIVAALFRNSLNATDL